jgi:catechol 2,3-dioxygenase-like lactoylglutathione lyase family enzyme
MGNVDFYTAVLGLRLVKTTVNFDDPGTYHLYYGDEAGRPSTILTFFPWRHVDRGRQGTGLTTATAFSIPPGSLGWWQRHLAEHGADVVDPPRDRDAAGAAEEVLTFRDPDGLVIDLVASPGDTRSGWDGVAAIPAEHAVRGLHSVTLTERDLDPTASMLTGLLGMNAEGGDDRARFDMGDAPGAVLDVTATTGAPEGLQAGGTVHHVAFALPTARPRSAGVRSSSTPGWRSPRSSTASTSPPSTSASRAGCCSRSPPTGRVSTSTSPCSSSGATSSCRRGSSPPASRSRSRCRRCAWATASSRARAELPFDCDHEVATVARWRRGGRGCRCAARRR